MTATPQLTRRKATLKDTHLGVEHERELVLPHGLAVRRAHVLDAAIAPRAKQKQQQRRKNERGEGVGSDGRQIGKTEGRGGASTNRGRHVAPC